MQVTLGDGRVVECAAGVTRLPPGPMPERLASEVVVPTTGHRRVNRDNGSIRDPNEIATGSVDPTTGQAFDGPGGGGSARAAIPVMLHAEAYVTPSASSPRRAKTPRRSTAAAHPRESR